MNEITNRMNPRASSEASLRLPASLSGNSSATSEAMVLPGPNRRGRDPVRVADDEGDSHRLAQGAPQAEHDRRPRPRCAYRAARSSARLPRSCSRRRRPIPCIPTERSRNTSRMVAAMNGTIITARINAAVKMPVPKGGPWNKAPITGASPSVSISPGLQVSRHQRRDHEEAPHAVDDRGDRREQFDRRAHRAPDPYRRQLGQEEGDAEGQRHGQDQRQNRRDERAIDRHRRAEHVANRVPVEPTRGTRAPNRRNAGSPPRNSATMIAPSSTSTKMPDARVTNANSASPKLDFRLRGLSAAINAACCKSRLLAWMAGTRAGRLTRPQRMGLPSGPFRSECQRSRTEFFTASGSGMYSSCVRDRITVLVGPVEEFDDVEAARGILRVFRQLDEGRATR